MADDDVRIAQLRTDLVPAKDAAVRAVLARWEAGEGDVLPLLTAMQQELTALQQELATLEGRRSQPSEADHPWPPSQEPGPAAAQQSGVGPDDDSSPAGSRTITVHLVAGDSSTTIVTTGSRLDLGRLERQHSVRIVRLAATHNKTPPAQEQYEHALTQQLQLRPGQHLWLEAEAREAAALLRHAQECAVFLAKVQAAQLTLALIRNQTESLALSQGLGVLKKHWSRLASWLVGRLVRSQLKVELPSPPALREA